MKFTPHPYQQYAINRVLSDNNVGMFLDMGLGKTVITLTAINELKLYRWAVRRPLVIAPKKVAEATWAAEAARWDHLKHLRVVPVLGSAAQRIRALNTPGDVWVTNRENTKWLVDFYRNDWPFDMVILDESSSFKNPSSQRFRALRLVLPRIQRVVCLTGTPSPNGLEDLWAQVYLLDRGQRLGKSITQFREIFCEQDPSYPGQQFRTWSLRPGAADAIRAAVADICVSMSAEDYLSLPDYVEDDIPVQLTPAAKRQYDKLEKDMLLEVDEKTITAQSAAVLNGKLLQLCSGAVYTGDGPTREVVNIHDCKIEAFMETLERLGTEHALVFYQYQHERDRLLAAVGKMGRIAQVYTGERDGELWNNGEADVLLAQPASCAYGLNLQQGGHHIIWFGLPNFAFELYAQANARLYRQGQTQPVIVHHLCVQGGMDEMELAALRRKGDVQGELIEALKARIAAAQARGHTKAV